MLDSLSLNDRAQFGVHVPKEYLDAVRGLSVEALDEIEKGIARYENTGLLKGKVLATIKSLNKVQPRRVARPKTLCLE